VATTAVVAGGKHALHSTGHVLFVTPPTSTESHKDAGVSEHGAGSGEPLQVPIVLVVVVAVAVIVTIVAVVVDVVHAPQFAGHSMLKTVPSVVSLQISPVTDSQNGGSCTPSHLGFGTVSVVRFAVPVGPSILVKVEAATVFVVLVLDIAVAVEVGSVRGVAVAVVVVAVAAVAVTIVTLGCSEAVVGGAAVVVGALVIAMQMPQ
jgi:hypothetical protein